MKKVLLISIVLTVINSCEFKQNDASEKQVENMLFAFYTQHFQIWETPSIRYDVLQKKLDSLMQKYCTSKLISEAKEAYENSGADILTYDLNGNINENLKVEKDTEKENGYKVSYMSSYSDVLGGPIKEEVVLNVTVVKEGENYKIASVIGSTKRLEEK